MTNGDGGEGQMSVLTEKFTRERFRELYADQKPNWELIDGVPEQKALGSKRHSYLQWILAQMLNELGFRPGELKERRHRVLPFSSGVHHSVLRCLRAGCDKRCGPRCSAF
jgi:Uma2 family endonuclease